MVKYAFIITCGFILGGMAVEYKHYFSHQVPVPIATLVDGGIYDGELRKGQLGGKGRIVWPSDSYYEGDFEEGLFHGQGVLHTPAFLYQGEFQRGNASGEGVIDYINGDKYQGQAVAGLPNGYGVLDMANGDVYKGEFKNGLYQGQGELVKTNGDIYIGSFKKGLFDGDGVYTRVSGLGETAQSEPAPRKIIYSGTFVNNQFSGEGVWIDGQKRYEGQFLQWLFHGEGLYSDSNGTYTGQFSNGVYEGKGVYMASDGLRYEGQFSEGHYHGQGRLITAFGDVYEGKFSRGTKHGKGQLTYAEELDGIEAVSGEWKYGKLIKSNHDQLVFTDPQLVEYALYHQVDMLDKALSVLPQNNAKKIDMYFVGVAGDGGQEVFRREVNFVENLFQENYQTKGKSVTLINSPLTYTQKPLATVTSIEKTLHAVANKMDEENDILFLYLTSHGSRDFTLQLSQPGLALDSLSAEKLGDILASLPVRHKVVVISACFSGGFVTKIKDDSTMVITAAGIDRSSFGCHDRAKMTYFGEAFFKDSLLKSSGFVDAFYRARDIVRGREAKEGFENSKPLIFKPKAIIKKLTEWREQMDAEKEAKRLLFRKFSG